MARIGLLLLSLILWSNVYAWYCNFSQTSDGWYEEGSMQCVGIDNQVALEQEYCGWYRPDDPICSAVIEPICVDSIEYQTLSCPPNYSGGIQQSRTFICKQASWTDWTVTSDNCTPNPPTCIDSFDTRTLQCPENFNGQITETKIGQCPDPYGNIIWTDWVESSNTCTPKPATCMESTQTQVLPCPSGYEGQITETRISQCPNPYGTEVWSDWLESQNSCTQSTTDPVSPISVTSPTSPVSPMPIESVIAPTIDVPQTINPAEPTIESVLQEEVSDTSDKVETSTNNQTDSPKEVKQDKQDGDKKESKDNIDTVVDNRKEIVHGFGLVLSLEILNKPMEFYQPPLEDAFSITQELPISAATRQFQLDLLKGYNLEDYYNSVSDYTWDRLRRGDILQ